MKQMWCGMKLRVASSMREHRLTWIVDDNWDGPDVGDEPGRENRPEPANGRALVMWIADRAASKASPSRDDIGFWWSTKAAATKAAQAVRAALNERTW